MSTRFAYAVRMRPAPLVISWRTMPARSTEALAEALTPLALQRISDDEGGGHVVEFGLQRATHEEALDEILVAAQALGYEIVEQAIVAWVERTVAGTVIGALGGGVVGGSSRAGGVAAFGAAVGAFVGAVVGARLRHDETIYRVERLYPRGWRFVPVSREATHWYLAHPARQ